MRVRVPSAPFYSSPLFSAQDRHEIWIGLLLSSIRPMRQLIPRTILKVILRITEQSEASPFATTPRPA